MRNKKVGKIINSLIILVALICIIVGVLHSSAFKRFLQRQVYETMEVPESGSTEEAVRESSTQNETEEPDIVYISPVDFESLWKTNKDIVAWIRVPGTNIDYPVVWNGDNEFYLNHDIEGNESVYGSIFLDADNKPEFTSRHNIMYGHHMRDKMMFHNIVLFKDESYFREHRDVYIYTPEREYHLKTMACLYTSPEGIRRQSKFMDEKSFHEYIDKMTEDCSFRELPDIMPERLWSFVTCSYETGDNRTILYCYEADDEGNAVKTGEELETYAAGE